MRISDWSSDVCSSDLVEPPAQRLAIGVHVGDRLGGDARIHRRLGDRDRDFLHQPRIERRGDDIFGAERVLGAVSERDFLWHLLARQRGEQIGRASGRERVCQYVSLSVVAGSLKKKKTQYGNNKTDNT